MKRLNLAIIQRKVKIIINNGNIEKDEVILRGPDSKLSVEVGEEK